MRIILFLLLIISFAANGQNQNISNGYVFDGEPFLATNPNNPQHIIVAWMGWKLGNRLVIKTKVSFNAGKTWSVSNNLPHIVSSFTSADPSIDFDNNGNVFVSYIDFTGYDVSPLDGGIYLCKSTDGGLTWNSPVEVITINSDPNKRPIDRPWISADRSSGNNQGNIYITSMNAKAATPPYNPYLTVSTDNGNSFNQWRYLDTINFLAGSTITQPMPTNCISANGIFYAVYPSYVPSQSLYAQFILASSTNAGNSLSYSTVFTSTTEISDTLAKKGYLLKADPSDANHLAFFYLDLPYGDIDIFMCESYNAGSSWTNPVRINDDSVSNNRMQDLLWADFDNDGDIVVAWRDRRNGADSTYETASEIYASFRKKDSLSFSINFTLSDSIIPYDSILAFSGNDFMSINLVDDTINAVWGDTRNGKLNIWFQRIAVDGTILSTQILFSGNETQVLVYPNPTKSNINIEGPLIKKISILNIEGKTVYSKDIKVVDSKTINIDLSILPKGIYLIRCKTKMGIFTKKIIKE